jgi:hypothetical protein
MGKKIKLQERNEGEERRTIDQMAGWLGWPLNSSKGRKNNEERLHVSIKPVH